MTGVTKCMLRMQEKQAATRSRIEDLNFEEKTKNKLVWDQKTVEYINKLPVAKYYEAKTEDDNSTMCTICQDEYQDDTDVLCLPCTHLFHETCIKSWLGKSTQCPNCRTKAIFNNL